jgi:hypothetical protein
VPTCPSRKAEADRTTCTTSESELEWILAVLSLLVCCQQSRAFSGIELYKICSGPYLERNQENICFGYIRGFSEGYYMGIAVGKMAEQKHGKPCYPQPPNDEPPDATQAELIVKKYMTDIRRN